MRAPVAALLVALAAGIVVATGSAATVTLGKGLPGWRLGQTYVRRTGLVRSELLKSPYGPGCLPNVSAARRIDYYRGLRVAWYPGARGRLRLVDVATQRAGDRSGDGFVVDSSARAAVRRRHPGATFAYAKGQFALGATSLTVFRRIGKESFTTLVYWFDARGVLTALEAFAGGC
jgi:hypothetical protein